MFSVYSLLVSWISSDEAPSFPDPIECSISTSGGPSGTGSTCTGCFANSECSNVTHNNTCTCTIPVV